MTYHRYDDHNGSSVVTMLVATIFMVVFTALGVFIGYLVFSPPANALPAACAGLNGWDCAAVMEGR